MLPTLKEKVRQVFIAKTPREGKWNAISDSQNYRARYKNWLLWIQKAYSQENFALGEWMN